MPVISNYNSVAWKSGRHGPSVPDQRCHESRPASAARGFRAEPDLRHSITKLIWNGDMIPYQQMLINDAFTNYRQILGDVTLKPWHGRISRHGQQRQGESRGRHRGQRELRAGNHATFQHGRRAAESGWDACRSDVDRRADSHLLQTNVTELARVFTGWTYAPGAGQAP